LQFCQKASKFFNSRQQEEVGDDDEIKDYDRDDQVYDAGGLVKLVNFPISVD